MQQFIRTAFFTLVIATLFACGAEAQILKPIKWDSQLSAKEVAQGAEVELIFTARIDNGWYLYSTDFDPNLGPMVTTFNFTKNPSYTLSGKIRPVSPKKKYDSLIWDGEYTYFTGKAEFRQTVKVLNGDFKVEATASYQVCSDIDGKCIPLEEDFIFANLKVTAPLQTGDTPTTTPAETTDNNTIQNTDNTITQPNTSEPTTEKANEDVRVSYEEDDSESANSSLLGFMLAAFLGGLAALLTPCVFPMIPMTVSFFTSGSGNRAEGLSKALIYGLSIIGIYTLIGVLVSLIMGPDFANFLATHWFPNLLFFVVFIVFALSFFGMFEIVLPSSFINKVDAMSDKGGLLGIFFMAFTLVLVSFSCTGPIVGSVLVKAAGGEILKPVVGMLGFSLAFALPFTLFAIFPSWLNSLPKSGGWLNSVKVILGFVELALAFKFLSVADQVYHWNLLDREIYIAIWTAIALSMGLYLLGFIRLPHDSPTDHIGVPRLLLGIFSFAFVIYLLPGMFGAPLKALSGYLPPQSTHSFDLASQIRLTASAVPSAQYNESQPIASVRFGDRFKLPHGLRGYFELKEGLEAARKLGKPLFIDFTGHGCVNCREMEANVWSNPEVLKRLQERYVIVALYVDDPLELPESEWVVSQYDGKVKKTIGRINADFQINRFQNNAQPYYVLLDHDETLLQRPKAYDLNVQNFVSFLDAGVKEFEQRQERISMMQPSGRK